MQCSGTESLSVGWYLVVRAMCRVCVLNNVSTSKRDPLTLFTLNFLISYSAYGRDDENVTSSMSPGETLPSRDIGQ